MKNLYMRKILLCGAFATAMITGTAMLTGCSADTGNNSSQEPAESSGTEDTTPTETEAPSETETEPESSSEPETEEVAEGIWNNPADISWIDPEKPMVAFAFDDGPVGTYSGSTAMRIQQALSDNGQHATFFYWGITLKDSTKEEIAMAYESGFEIGNHTWSHPYLTQLSEEEARADIEQMRAALEEITGQTNFLIRAPYLSTNQTVLQIPGVPFVSCGLDTKDWNNATTDDIINTITTAYENGTLENQILLMHETYSTTAEAVEYLVPYLVENGYQVVSVSEMFKANGVDMENGVVYNNCPKKE